MHNIKHTKISQLPVRIEPDTKQMDSRHLTNWATEAESSLHTAVIQ